MMMGLYMRNLVEAMAKRPPFTTSEKRVVYGGDVHNTAAILGLTLRSGDVAMVMGAGDIYVVTEMLFQEHRKQS